MGISDIKNSQLLMQRNALDFIYPQGGEKSQILPNTELNGCF
jgi:hypothetical protein